MDPLRTPSSISFYMSIITAESFRGVGDLAPPMAIACSCSRVGHGRVPLGEGTRDGAIAAALSAA